MVKIFRLALLATCVPLFAATPDERREASSALLDGVSAIDLGGGAIPGPLVLLSDNAIPLADCELDGTRAFAAAAAFTAADAQSILATLPTLRQTSISQTRRPCFGTPFAGLAQERRKASVRLHYAVARKCSRRCADSALRTLVG